MISTGDLRRGAMFELDGQIVSVLDSQHQKIGRGSAQVRMKLRNIRTGSISDTTVQAGTKFPLVRLERTVCIAVARRSRRIGIGETRRKSRPGRRVRLLVHGGVRGCR